MNTSYSNADNRFRIHTANGHNFLKVGDILYCRAKGNYTEIITADRKTLVATEQLHDIEAKLPAQEFFRCHHSYLVGRRHVSGHIHSVTGNTGGELLLCSGEKVPVSKKRKKATLQWISGL